MLNREGHGVLAVSTYRIASSIIIFAHGVAPSRWHASKRAMGHCILSTSSTYHSFVSGRLSVPSFLTCEETDRVVVALLYALYEVSVL